MARSTPAQNERGAASTIWRRPPGRASGAYRTAKIGSGIARLTGAVPAERHDGKPQPVQVVVDVEVTREAGAREPRLVPGAVRPLGVDEPGNAPLDRLRPALLDGRTVFDGGVREEGEQGPGRLRC